MRGARSNLVAALLAAVALGDAAASAADPTPSKVLEGRGLKRSGLLYVVDAESDFLPQVAKLQPTYRQLKATYDRFATIVQTQAAYDQLNDEWTLVNERLRNVQAEIDTHPPLNNNDLRQNWNNLLEAERQLRFRYNELGRDVNLLSRRLVSDAEKERVQGEFQRQRDDFLARSKELRTQAEKIKAEYDELARDDAVKKAVETLKDSTKSRIGLGPSPGFKNASAWLTNAVRATSPESLRPRSVRRDARNPAKGKGVGRSAGATPGKERQAKGATKGTRANPPASDDSEARPH